MTRFRHVIREEGYILGALIARRQRWETSTANTFGNDGATLLPFVGEVEGKAQFGGFARQVPQVYATA